MQYNECTILYKYKSGPGHSNLEAQVGFSCGSRVGSIAELLKSCQTGRVSPAINACSLKLLEQLPLLSCWFTALYETICT